MIILVKGIYPYFKVDITLNYRQHFYLAIKKMGSFIGTLTWIDITHMLNTVS